MRYLTIIFCAGLVLFCLDQAQARIIHVPADSSTIQTGINGAVDGDTVLVARGHYYERIDFLGKAILVASNFIFDNDTITIDSTIIDGDTAVVGVSDTGSVVIFCNGEDSTSVLQGFTIQNGIGTFPDYRWGGGIYCYYSPTITNNVITGNSAYFGGGIYSYWQTPVIRNNTITGNSADRGGGIARYQGFGPGVVISHNSISGNSADRGGGISCYGSGLPAISNNTISDISIYPGSESLCHSSVSTISNNTITDNSAITYGGGIHFDITAPHTGDKTAACNFNDPAGEIRFEEFITIINNTINGNSADSGGGIYSQGWGPTISNNIISNSPDGEGICHGYAGASISYNDVWNNADGNFSDCPAGIGDTTWGTNFNGTPCDSFYNIIRDPIFVGLNNYELLCNSPCVDAGDPSVYVPHDSGGCRVDMGAHEYHYSLGDANGDCVINSADVVFVVNYLFKNGSAPCPIHAGDANCDGVINSADVVYLINYLFKGGPPPCS